MKCPVCGTTKTDPQRDGHTIYECALAENNKLKTALQSIREQTGLDDPEFGNFRPLQFAARLGLIDHLARDALQSGSDNG